MWHTFEALPNSRASFGGASFRRAIRSAWTVVISLPPWLWNRQTHFPTGLVEAGMATAPFFKGNCKVNSVLLHGMCSSAGSARSPSNATHIAGQPCRVPTEKSSKPSRMGALPSISAR